MRIAVVGTGLMAMVRARQVRADSRVRWVGLASENVPRARALADDVGASSGGSIEEILSMPLDAVVVSGSSDDRAAHLRRAMRLRVPILAEKPLATDLLDCVRVVTEARQAGVQIQVGFQRRFDAEFAAARRLIVEGRLGELYSVHLTSHDHEVPPEQFVATSGGMFSDLGVHDYDLARWLTGDEVAEVYARGSCRTGWNYFHAHGDVDTAITMLHMTSGLTVVVSSARHSPDGHDVRAEIFGSRHNVTVGHGAYAPLRTPDEVDAAAPLQAYPNFLTRFQEAFDRQTQAFLDWVAGTGGNQCPAEEGLASLRVAAAAQLSHNEQRPVALAEVPGLAS